eukprot:NODE_1028_length_1090_cov_367.431316_g717_i0.p3 GENE.NODE_1028_length_1090_cov_367.431316_g717_i0~~NODE_1028_length_1090_cov_367.431316_g717_i0.p3  ORF type:complete len:150 (+),score=46.87 NODE_1028_length_1090_cov_367.431316_g717_i0:569-1018(+)
MSAYCASKFAVEAFSTALRMEMVPYKVQVAVLEPGFMRTPIVMGAGAKLIKKYEQASPEIQAEYGADYPQRAEAAGKDLVHKVSADPQWVIDDLVHALFARTPCRQYQCGLMSKMACAMLWVLPGWMFDRVCLSEVKSQAVVVPGPSPF